MAGVSEENRRILSIGFGLVGLTLVAIGAVMTARHVSKMAAVYSRPVPSSRPATSTTPSSTQVESKLKAIEALAFYTVVFVVIFGVSTLAWLRWSRRFRKYLLREPSPPTAADDIWASHRLPEEDESSGPAGGEPDSH